MNAREYLDILHVAERLKDTPRHCTTTKRRTESVAEHSWRISLMAFLLRHEFPELDIDKVVDMCLIHDLGECFTGDIPTFIKTDDDREAVDAGLIYIGISAGSMFAAGNLDEGLYITGRWPGSLH